MRPGSVIAVCAAMCLLAGCGTSERDQVQSKVQEFAKAASTRDAKTLCSDVIAPALIEAYLQRGITCQQYWSYGLKHVKLPTLAIGKIIVSGDNAEVITLTGAKGEVSSLDAIKLVKVAGGWRITSLGSPVIPRRPARTRTTTVG
jgi:hypothetical protein